MPTASNRLGSLAYRDTVDPDLRAAYEAGKADSKRHGGPRTPGPGKRLGRPLAADQPVKRHTVWLTDAQAERLRVLGGGSLSAGLRQLLDVECNTTAPLAPTQH